MFLSMCETKRLADFPTIERAELINCGEEITESEVHEAFKWVAIEKLPELDGLPYKLYLRL